MDSGHKHPPPQPNQKQTKHKLDHWLNFLKQRPKLNTGDQKCNQCIPGKRNQEHRTINKSFLPEEETGNHDDSKKTEIKSPGQLYLYRGFLESLIASFSVSSLRGLHQAFQPVQLWNYVPTPEWPGGSETIILSPSFTFECMYIKNNIKKLFCHKGMETQSKRQLQIAWFMVQI